MPKYEAFPRIDCPLTYEELIRRDERRRIANDIRKGWDGVFIDVVQAQVYTVPEAKKLFADLIDGGMATRILQDMEGG